MIQPPYLAVPQAIEAPPETDCFINLAFMTLMELHEETGRSAPDMIVDFMIAARVIAGPSVMRTLRQAIKILGDPQMAKEFAKYHSRLHSTVTSTDDADA